MLTFCDVRQVLLAINFKVVIMLCSISDNANFCICLPILDNREFVFINQLINQSVNHKFCRIPCVSCKPLVWNADATAYSSAYFGRGTGGIYLDNLDCTGRELRLVDCSHDGIGVHNCDHSADAGLKCQGITFIYLSRECICIPLL